MRAEGEQRLASIRAETDRALTEARVTAERSYEFALERTRREAEKAAEEIVATARTEAEAASQSFGRASSLKPAVILDAMLGDLLDGDDA